MTTVCGTPLNGFLRHQRGDAAAFAMPGHLTRLPRKASDQHGTRATGAGFGGTRAARCRANNYKRIP